MCICGVMRERSIQEAAGLKTAGRREEGFWKPLPAGPILPVERDSQFRICTGQPFESSKRIGLTTEGGWDLEMKLDYIGHG